MPEITNLDDLESTPHAEVFDQQAPRTVRLQLEAGQRIPPHQHPGEDIVLHLLSGHIGLELGDEQCDLHPGDIARFSGNQDISPAAVEESVAVLVFAPST
ncbi:cupin domain-containing protein [Haladaptatus sp. NG-SE-30]